MEIEEIVRLVRALEQPNKIERTENKMPDWIGTYCIFRTYSAGVWAGRLAAKNGMEVVVHDAIRLWQWKAEKSISLSAVAEFGVNPEGCKFAPPVEEVWIEAIEIITCSEKAKASIKGVKYVEI